MNEYVVLQKLSPSKILDAIQSLRKIPEDGIEGIDNYHTMNIFGTWNVGVWFNAKNTKTALDFVHNKLKKVSGVVDSFVLSMFQQYQTIGTSTSNPEKTPEKPEKVIAEAKH